IMPLLTSVPPDLLRSLSGNGVQPIAGTSDAPAPESNEAPVIFETDLTESGEFGVEWLVIDRDSVKVFGPNGKGPAELRRYIPLHQIETVRAETFVGNGLLEATTAGETIPLLRYTQALAGDAHAVSRAL